jgi:hypothetical protein
MPGIKVYREGSLLGNDTEHAYLIDCKGRRIKLCDIIDKLWEVQE